MISLGLYKYSEEDAAKAVEAYEKGINIYKS